MLGGDVSRVCWSAGVEAPTYEAVSVATQLVAGTVFYIKMRLDNDAYVHLKVLQIHL